MAWHRSTENTEHSAARAHDEKSRLGKRPRRPWLISGTGFRTRSGHLLRQCAAGVLRRDLAQADGLDLRALAFAAELKVALLANGLGGFACGLEPLAGVELV